MKKKIHCSGDILSWRAFYVDNVRKGVLWDDQFNYFIPLIINSGYTKQRKVLQLLKESLIKIKKENKWKPEIALEILPKLMNEAIMNFWNKSTETQITPNICEKALQSYCTFHQMLLVLVKQEPTLISLADSTFKKFLSDPNKVSTKLRDLLCILTISTPTWDNLKFNIVKEFFARKIQTFKSIWNTDQNVNQKLQLTFNGFKNDLLLFVIQVYFLNTFGRPEGKKMLEFYDRSYGRISEPMVMELSKGINVALTESKNWIKDYSKVWQKLRMEVPKEEILEKLFVDILAKRDLEVQLKV